MSEFSEKKRVSKPTLVEVARVLAILVAMIYVWGFAYLHGYLDALGLSYFEVNPTLLDLITAPWRVSMSAIIVLTIFFAIWIFKDIFLLFVGLIFSIPLDVIIILFLVIKQSVDAKLILAVSSFCKKVFGWVTNFYNTAGFAEKFFITRYVYSRKEVEVEGMRHNIFHFAFLSISSMGLFAGGLEAYDDGQTQAINDTKNIVVDQITLTNGVKIEAKVLRRIGDQLLLVRLCSEELGELKDEEGDNVSKNNLKIDIVYRSEIQRTEKYLKRNSN